MNKAEYQVFLKSDYWKRKRAHILQTIKNGISVKKQWDDLVSQVRKGAPTPGKEAAMKGAPDQRWRCPISAERRRQGLDIPLLREGVLLSKGIST